MLKTKQRLKPYIVYVDETPVAVITAASKTQAASLVVNTVAARFDEDVITERIEQGWPSDDDLRVISLDKPAGTLL